MTCLQTSFVVLVLSKSESLTLPEYAVGFPGGASGKEPACQCGRHKSRGCGRSVRKIPWRRAWQPTPGLLPKESHGQRRLVGYRPWGRDESDMTEVTYHACMASKVVFLWAWWHKMHLILGICFFYSTSKID